MLAELKLASTVVVPHLDWYRAFSVYGRPAHMLRGIVDMRDDVLMNPSPLTFSRQQFFPVQMMPVVESVQKAVASKMGVNFNACLAYKYMTPSDHISPHADNENTVPLFHPPGARLLPLNSHTKETSMTRVKTIPENWIFFFLKSEVRISCLEISSVTYSGYECQKVSVSGRRISATV